MATSPLRVGVAMSGDDLAGRTRALRRPVMRKLLERVELDERQLLAVSAAVVEAANAGLLLGIGETLATIRAQLVEHGVDLDPFTEVVFDPDLDLWDGEM